MLDFEALGIDTVNDDKRGCGYRKGGGLYMMGGKLSAPCGKLPYILTICPVCHSGIKQARGWTWVDASRLIVPGPCFMDEETGRCSVCLMCNPPERAGLLWIGERHYPTVHDFTEEARRLGISRRIAAVPRDFVVGEHYVFLAHPKGQSMTCPDCAGEDDECDTCGGDGEVHQPAIVTYFMPDRIEYICKGDETEDEIEAMRERGLTPVRVLKNVEHDDGSISQEFVDGEETA